MTKQKQIKDPKEGMKTIKFCPLLLGREERKALTYGAGDYIVPVLYACKREDCVAFDSEKKWCNHYNQPTEYKYTVKYEPESEDY